MKAPTDAAIRKAVENDPDSFMSEIGKDALQLESDEHLIFDY